MASLPLAPHLLLGLAPVPSIGCAASSPESHLMGPTHSLALPLSSNLEMPMSPRDTRSLGSIRTITRYPVWSSRVVDGSCSLRVTSSDSPTVRIPATSSMAALLDTSIGATTAVPGILSTYTIVACTLYSTCVCTVSPTMAVCIGWLFLSQAFNLPITKLQDLGVVESIKFELSCRHHIITVPQSYLSHSFLHEVIIINCVVAQSYFRFLKIYLHRLACSLLTLVRHLCHTSLSVPLSTVSFDLSLATALPSIVLSGRTLFRSLIL